jgi:cell division protein FtsB
MLNEMNKTVQSEKSEAVTASGPIPRLALDWTMRVWRPGGTVVVVGLALLLTWHVINGKNGLSIWNQKRTEDRQLQREIKDLNDENARLRDHIERLKSDPDEIAREAREKLHYAKPNEVIVALPEAQTQAQPTGEGK